MYKRGRREEGEGEVEGEERRRREGGGGGEEEEREGDILYTQKKP